MSRPTPATRADFSTFQTLTTRWFDNDIYGHMNNAVHYQLFDTAVNGYLVQQGLLDPRAGTNVFLVVETGCRYHAELAFPDLIDAGIAVTRLGRSSVHYRIGLFRNSGSSAAAEGHFIHVNVSRQSRRPEPIDDRTRAALQALMPG